MGIEKDTAFKYIGKNYRNILLELPDLPKDIDFDDLEEVTVELENLEIAQFRPDLIVRNKEAIIMVEFESSYLTDETKSRFLTYIALYNSQYNKDKLDIYFVVITNKNKTDVVSYKLDKTILFNIRVVNINDLGFDEIINNTKNKIKNNESFSGDELVNLALTSIMPKTKSEIQDQFHWLHDRVDEIIYEDDNGRTSFVGLILLLSNSYFDKNDELRKSLQGIFMNKIDCITEKMEESREEGRQEGMKKGMKKGREAGIEEGMKKGREVGIEEGMKKADEEHESDKITIGINLLVEDNIPIDRVSKLVGIPVGRLVIEYGNYMLENNIPSVNLNF